MTLIDEIAGSKITFSHNGVKKVIDIGNLFDINEDNLTKEFATQASLYAYFATLQAEAERLQAKAEMKKDQEYAKSDEYWRAYLDKREKKYTEAVIKSNVIRDEDYDKANNALINITYDLNVIKAIVRALQMRAEMLISLGAHLRQEYSMTGMSVNKAFDEATRAVKEKLSKK